MVGLLCKGATYKDLRESSRRFACVSLKEHPHITLSLGQMMTLVIFRKGYNSNIDDEGKGGGGSKRRFSS